MTETEKKLRSKIQEAGDNPDDIIAEVKECPDWFLMEGGSDGTFSHVRWHGEFGRLKPEITDFAVECGGKV